ncbi:uncharacterized protein LOC133194575 [Saccostrea echinata]|nr:uncharacterized protein LOC133194575 [Saccostrea echinata]
MRGTDEHRNLELNQFQLDKEPMSLTFYGRANKTYKGGLNQRHISPKTIKHVFSDPKLFLIYEEYIQLVRMISTDENGSEPFYRRPLENKNNLKTFSKQCLGVNKLSKLMKSICEEGGLKGAFSNHSGKRTCATQLYQAGIQEQEIMGRTGHRSVQSVRKYKRPSGEMLEEISNVLEPPVKREKVEMEVSESTERMCSKSGCTGVTAYNNCVFEFKF